MVNEVLFKKWIEKEKRTSLAKKRSYSHFDLRINFPKNISFFRSFFSNSKNIVRHPFYPFIRMDIITPRYKKSDEKNEEGKFIRKMATKLRPISYSAHFDAFIYSWYSTLLTEKYEAKIKEYKIYDCVLAYIEKGKSNIDFSHSVFEYIKEQKDCVAMAFDISSFFDGLDHEHLKKMWGLTIDEDILPEDHFKIFKTLTEYTYIEKQDLEKQFPFIVEFKNKKTFIPRICSPTNFRERVRGNRLIKKNSFINKISDSKRLGSICGIPQGSPISACLSNIYMIDFDIAVNNKMKEYNGVYYRYCDDIIVVVNTEDQEVIKNYISNEIRKYHLEINQSKTEVTYFRIDSKMRLRGYDETGNYRNLQYLGFEFNGENTYIRSSSISRYNSRLNSRIRENLKAAYGKKSIGLRVFKKTLLNRFTEKGERNFISYARRAKNTMQSKTIYKQYKNSIIKVAEKFSARKLEFEIKRNPKRLMD